MGGALSLAVRSRVNERMQNMTEIATRVSLRSSDYTKDRDRRLSEIAIRLRSGAALRMERADARLNASIQVFAREIRRMFCAAALP